MSLIIKPPSWGYCTTNLTGTPAISASTGGTGAAAGGSANTDGTAVALITAITHDVEFLVISFWGCGSSGFDSSALCDILIDPAGGTSWSSNELIQDLLCGYALAATQSVAPPYYYFFPVWIKSGSSIGARIRCATASLATRISIAAMGGNANPASWWCGQNVTSIGITAASSKGTDHTSGNSGAYSAWTNLGSTLPAACGALQFAAQGTNSNTTQSAFTYFFEFGTGSTRIGPNILRSGNTSETGYALPTGPIFCALPAGTQLQVRGTSNSTSQAIDVAAYAVH